ncbi:MAG: hypothetical protein HY319_11835 [Armatimonadetes bacterium]|nr:hypothetical protein [Armatimonadota bacterium]
MVARRRFPGFALEPRVAGGLQSAESERGQLLLRTIARWTLGYSVAIGGREAFLDDLYVKPEHRSRGGRDTGGLLRGR